MNLLPEKGDWRGLSLLVLVATLLALALGAVVVLISDYGSFSVDPTPAKHVAPHSKAK